MRCDAKGRKMTPIDDGSRVTGFVRTHRAIVVVDVVDSVRLIRDYEDDVIDRWRRFVDEVRTQVLPQQGGRMVKSLGDGMLLEFDTVPGSVRAALDLQQRIGSYNLGGSPQAELFLRVGVHDADVVLDDIDIYGAGVNLAARLATLAGPGETIISPQARDALVAGLDVDIEDLGDCYLKHFSEPQRAYRAGPVGRRATMWPGTEAGAADRVGIAVIPFTVHGDGPPLLGEILADDLIAQLSRLPQLHVISRLSTTAFRDREHDLGTLLASLGCRYVAHGSCTLVGGKVRLRASLVDCRDAGVIWADLLEADVAGVLDGESPLVENLLTSICHALVEVEVRRATTMPLPSLQSYTILLGAIATMHRLSLRDFERSREMLQYLIERHPRATAPRAWLGKWHVMRVAQGWSHDPVADSNQARQVVGQALALDPQHSLALAIDGLICAYINRDLATAGARYEAATQANPSEGLAWLFQSALHSYVAEGASAVACALRAQRLSPLDPMRYYYDNFISTAKLSAGDYAGAIEYGQRSLRANRKHGSTLRILAIAQVFEGRFDDARASVAALLLVEPSMSASRFLDRYPGAAAAHAQSYAQALRAAGLPA